MHETTRRRCEETAEAAFAAEAWVRRNADVVGNETLLLSRELRRHGRTARKLARALSRPMGVGVFGASQAGKSYLISGLARSPESPLLAVFGNEEIDFIAEINPAGGEESTGLVTRFTIREEKDLGAAAPANFPVRLRLLSETDILRILCNTYYLDLLHKDERVPEADAIAARVSEAARIASDSPTGPLGEDDLLDLQKYVEESFKTSRGSGPERVNRLERTFWPEVVSLVPRLKLEERASLLALLWGDLEEFTRLYVMLAGALSRLGHAEEAFAPLASLDRGNRANSIISVRSLAGLVTGGGPPVTLATADGRQADLPLSVATALIAELTIRMRHRPWTFFDHTDLLDFPGWRSREEKEIDEFRSKENGIEGLFRRGKVAVLFERACEDRELNSMLLCVGPSVQEVKSLPEVISDWIVHTHGESPEHRAGKQVALFFILTKFDQMLQDISGDRDPQARWSVRLRSSLLEFFGPQPSWPERWSREGDAWCAFDNVFWWRASSIKDMGLFEYDDAGLEVGVNPQVRDRIDSLRGGFVGNLDVRRHFAECEAAWEAVMSRDGGAAFLAAKLAPLCHPDLKRVQIDGEIRAIREAIEGPLSRYFVGGDLGERVARKQEQANRLAVALVGASSQFGDLLADLQISEDDLRDVYFRIEAGAPATDGGPSGTQPKRSTGPIIGTRADKRSMLAALGLDVPADERAGSGTTAERPAVRSHRDQAERFADAAIELWVRMLRERTNGALFPHAYGFDEDDARTLAFEISTAAGRDGLLARIAEAARRAMAILEHRGPELPSRIAATQINAFVDWLGFDRVPLESRPKVLRSSERVIFRPRPPVTGMLALGEDPEPFEAEYVVDWITALREVMIDGVRQGGGQRIDVEQNESLGRILASLGAA